MLVLFVVFRCGMCGMGSERCGTDLRWASAGACLGQGECAEGATEMMGPTMYCGLQARLCSATCEWGAWDVLVEEGECRPGKADCDLVVGLDQLCDDTCHFIDNPECPRP